jgi:hypothetical protein
VLFWNHLPCYEMIQLNVNWFDLMWIDYNVKRFTTIKCETIQLNVKRFNIMWNDSIKCEVIQLIWNDSTKSKTIQINDSTIASLLLYFSYFDGNITVKVWFSSFNYFSNVLFALFFYIKHVITLDLSRFYKIQFL